MTFQKLKSTFREIVTHQRRLLAANKKITKFCKNANYIDKKAKTGQQSLKRKIDKKNWMGLKNVSLKEYKDFRNKIDNLIALSKKRSDSITKRNSLTVQLKPNLKPVKAIKNWNKRKAEIISALKAKRVKTNRINIFIRSIEAADFKKHEELYKRIEIRKSESINEAFNKLLKAYVFHYYTYCCAKINSNTGKKIRLSSIRSKISVYERTISESYQTVKNFIKKEQDVIKNCKSIEKNISAIIENELLPVALSLYKRRTADKKTFDECRDLSIKAGMLIRRAILLSASCKRIRFYFNTKELNNSYKKWKTAASQTTIKEFPKGSQISFSALAQGGASFSRKEISLKGRVMKVEIRHVRKKPISHAFITNGRYIVVATIPHIKIDSGGMSPGTYVELSGEWRQRNSEALNKPSLSVSRIDHSAASRTNWLSWLSLEMNDIYNITPHSLNVSLSWKPGVNGAINSIKYSTLT